MIVFMGTPEFAVPILQMLIDQKYDVGLVVTQPDRFVGRKKVFTESAVKMLAKKYDIEVFQPENIRMEYQYILDQKPSLLITASYGQILPKILLESVKSVNIHGSLLPKYRGGAPIQYALFNGDQKTGITLMEMVYKMDAGAMIKQRSIEILNEDNYGSLSHKLSLVGSELLKETLPSILSNKYTPIPQNENEVTFAYTLKYRDEALNFERSVDWNHNRVRGLSPQIGAYFKVDNVLIKVFKSHKSDIMNLRPKEISISSKRLFIGCSDGALEVLEIQQSGKKQMDVKSYLNGQVLLKDGGFVE